MGIGQIVRMSIQSIIANKVRSLLTMLGIIIGVTSVIALVSIVDSTTGMIKNTLRDMGTNVISVSITGKGTSKEVKVDEFLSFIDSNKELYICASPIVQARVTIKYESSNINTIVEGANESYKVTNNFKVANGRFINSFDVESKQKVAIVGSYVKKEIFGENSSIGKKIKINGNIYTVAGELEEKQGSSENSVDNKVIVPYTAITRLTNSSKVSSYVVSAASSDITKDAKGQLNKFMERKLGTTDAFYIISQDEILDKVNEITGTLSIMLGCIAGISLIVGGVGIMNIMLVAVTERTREIGIRKAIGAKRKDILIQFLIESSIVSSIGGIIGIGFGWLLTIVGGKLLAIDVTVGIGIIIISFIFSLSIGVFFGIYPANKASKLDPIEALRYE